MRVRAFSVWLRYGAALLAVGLATLLHALALPFIQTQSPYVFLLAAVMFSAWFGRLGPGVLATVIAALVADFLFIPPYWTLFTNGLIQDARLVLFIAEGLFISGLVSRLQTALERSEKGQQALINADRCKDQFLALLAHELRGPLAPITQGVRLLRDPRTDRRTSGRTLDMIDRQLQVVVRLVDDLLDVSRIARGKVRLQKRPVKLASVLMRAVEISQPLIDARRHEFTVTTPPDSAWVLGDPIRLAQVFANLLNNAAKYTPEGGRIRLSASVAGTEVCVGVRDNGIGIPRDMLPHVFELFTQVEQARPHSDGGLGLGLTLVRSLIEGHGGRVEAVSAGSGKGSEFIVRLPAIPAPEATAPRQSKPARQPSRQSRSAPEPRPPAQPVARPAEDSAALRILIVDDNHDSAESLGMLLSFDGHEVRTAADGAAALETAAEFSPDVVLLDISLPDMDGYEVARRLRARDGERDLLLVAMTGHARPEDRRRSHEAGFDAHLAKPVSLDDLQDLLGAPATV